MKIESKAVDRTALEAKVQEFLRNGGTITQCAPGPSENVTYKHAMRGRPRPKADGATPQPTAEKKAPPNDS
ncbi:MAG TPA: hypothetical protein VD978_13165 [Azospirillum sp.]|nr:hypothetical protein [Azospirillum sp.]